ncbi:MAG TPA: PQQ-binding-like beta-propeller repeat protein [Kofleriaceae bacterium]|nr:PQQ-binding-like beta-propeller repeat protein [Kofleriaceae bacterium]
MKPPFAAVLLCACGASKSPLPSPSPAATTTSPGAISQKPKVHHSPDDDRPPGEIVTDQVNAMNSAKYGRPPVTFNTGHPTAIKPPAVTHDDAGYQVAFGAAAVTTPTVYDHELIVSGGFSSRNLFAYEATTGKPLWGLDLGDDGPSSSACEDGRCVINTESCTIFAIDAKTGKHLWSYFLGDPLTSSPTIAQGRVFAAYPAASTSDGKEVPPGANHVLAAFDLATGKIDWQLWLDGDVMSAPVAVGEYVYVSTFAGTVIKLEQATGKVRYATKVAATSAPVVQFDQDGVESMYYTRRGEAEKAGAEEELIRADHNEPKTKYKTASKKADYLDDKVQGKTAHAAKAKADDANNGFSGGAPASASANIAYGAVGVDSVATIQGFQGSRTLRMGDKSFNTMGDEVIATDAETGNKLWSYKLAGNTSTQGGFLGTPPLAAGNNVLIGTLDGNVLRIDPATGKTSNKYAVGAPVRAQPVVADGWIYVGTDDGRLVAIDTHDPTITGWPTWGGNAQRTGTVSTKTTY